MKYEWHRRVTDQQFQGLLDKSSLNCVGYLKPYKKRALKYIHLQSNHLSLSEMDDNQIQQIVKEELNRDPYDICVMLLDTPTTSCYMITSADPTFDKLRDEISMMIHKLGIEASMDDIGRLQCDLMDDHDINS